MKLTVLGNNGPYPKANGACSGYLLEEGDIKILLDCGNGVFSNLQNICTLEDIDAIIVTHLHPDHISDLFVLRYALQLKNLQIPLYAPPNPITEFQRLAYKDVYLINKIHSDLNIQIGELTITFQKLKHVIENFGICIKTPNKKFVYTGDMMYDDNIISFAKDSDMLLIEAGVLEKDLNKNPPHLSAKQSCNIGREAKVKKLLLTHFYPQYSMDEYIKETLFQFDGLLVLCMIMKTYSI